MNEEEEKILIHALLNASTREEAFRKLVGTYQERLYWHIRKIVLNHDDADDVLQETFIKIFRNIASFQAKSSLFTWMYRIATNEAISHITKAAKLKKLSNEEYNEEQVNKLKGDVYFEGDAIQLKLQQAIASLPERQRMVFNMRYFDEMPYKDISRILDVTEGGLKSAYHLANQKILVFLKENETF